MKAQIRRMCGIVRLVSDILILASMIGGFAFLCLSYPEDMSKAITDMDDMKATTHG